VPDKYDIADPNDPNTLRVPFMFVPHGCEPGEAPEPGQSYDVMRDAIAARRAAEEVFADPGRFVGIVRTAADQQSEPGANVAPSAQGQTQPNSWPGVEVRLPDGSRIPDPNSPTGYVMSRVQDLGPVAAAGRQFGATYRRLASSPKTAELAKANLYGSLGLSVGHGGTYDYQRSGHFYSGYTQFPQFRDVSNVNVGLLAQQAGLTLDQALDIAGLYAKYFSSNAMPGQEHGLDPRTAEFIKIGFRIGESGAFGQPNDR
jgi:hypothetical protein